MIIFFIIIFFTINILYIYINNKKNKLFIIYLINNKNKWK